MRPSAKIVYLDGTRLYRAIVAGIRQVISKQEFLNNINVFPVPDRDTGTNMALTLNAILESTYSIQNDNIHHLLDVVADAALNGARGNSGAILAQFFLGFSEGAKTVEAEMTTNNFVVAITTAVNFAHKALSEPKEGTILTVLRDFDTAITRYQLENQSSDFVELLFAGIQCAQQSLQNTVGQLKELKKAGVVDAGAQGFVEFLNGIYQFILNGSIKQLKEDITDVPVVKFTETTAPEHEIDMNFRYCTECLIHKTDRDIDRDELRQALESLGNSLIVAGTASKTKVHIHTNDPKNIFLLCQHYGNISGEKADDMIQQQNSYEHRKSQVAILTDSAADLPSEVISDLNIHVVPIAINFGKHSFLDKVTMTPKEFYHAIKTTTEHPTTSQPSFGDFNRQYQYLATHFDAIISLHLPQALSGTFSASKKAAEKVPHHQTTIQVLDTCNTSAGQGLIVMYAAEAARLGYSQADIIQFTDQIIQKTHFYAAITNLDYLVRGGRLSIKLKYCLDLLKITLLTTINKQGKVRISNLFVGRNKLSQRLLSLARKKTEKGKKYRFAIVHTDIEREAIKLAQLIKKTLKDRIDQLFILPCCASLAVHAGPGALGIAIQEYIPLSK